MLPFSSYNTLLIAATTTILLQYLQTVSAVFVCYELPSRHGATVQREALSFSSRFRKPFVRSSTYYRWLLSVCTRVSEGEELGSILRALCLFPWRASVVHVL